MHPTAWVACGYAVLSVVTLIAYGLDKRLAIAGRRRISERTLHLLELLGGWPGALVGQSLFRHKRRKLSYMTVFTCIVLLHVSGWVVGWRMGWWR